MKWRDEFVTVPFFDSLVAGELDALVGSFAGDDRRACALEHNVVRWGKTELPPEAGVAVYVGGERGKLAAARIYDDVDPHSARGPSEHLAGREPLGRRG